MRFNIIDHFEIIQLGVDDSAPFFYDTWLSV